MTPDTTAPLVSIAIVAHNNWPELELAVESALCQSWPNLQVIVVDNDSTDETAREVSRRYAKRVGYYHQPNVMDGGGYNRGIAESKGEFVQLLDGDDFLAPNKITLQMDVFRDRPASDIVYGDARQFQGQAGRPDWSDWNTGPQDDMLATLIDPAGEGGGLVIHSALFRRRALEKVGPWDESLVGADFDYWLRAAWAGCVFTYSPGAWCFHRRRAAQMSSDSSAMVHRTVKTLTKALGYVDREPYRSAIKARLAGLRYAAAIGNPKLSRTQALEELKAARELDGDRVSALPFGIAYAVATIPGARRLLRLSPFSAARKAASAAMGVRD